MKPQLDPTEKNKRKITKRREDTNLIRKNCKEIWEYISKREEAGKSWSIWFPIAMTSDRVRWVLGTRKKSFNPTSPLAPECETKRSSVLVSQWRKFYRCYYAREKFTAPALRTLNDTCLAHLKYVLDSGYPIYNERLVKPYQAIGSQCRMFCWTHDVKGGVFWNTLFPNDSPHGETPTVIEVYESFMNAVMSDTLDHAL